MASGSSNYEPFVTNTDDDTEHYSWDYENDSIRGTDGVTRDFEATWEDMPTYKHHLCMMREIFQTMLAVQLSFT